VKCEVTTRHSDVEILMTTSLNNTARAVQQSYVKHTENHEDGNFRRQQHRIP
jgi:hypothetical protein